MARHRHFKSTHTDQRGLVSILLVMIIMIILSLVVIAFVRLTTREQRQTLDRQLNSQAFYAAESGVNDAERLISAHSDLADRDYTGCNDFVDEVRSRGLQIEPQISADGPVSYSCLIVDSTPTSLIYDNVTTNSSVVIPVQSSENIQFLDIAWQDATENNADISGCPDLGDYPQQLSSNCRLGMLRVEFISGNIAGRASLANNTGVVFAQPSSAGGTPGVLFNSISGNGMGRAQAAGCVTGGATKCRFAINMNGSDRSGYLRIRSLYRDSQIEISARTGGRQLELRGAQIAVDVTGRANDVLKRIAVRREISRGTGVLPEYALQSKESLCKRFTLDANGNTSIAPTDPVFPLPGWCSPSGAAN